MVALVLTILLAGCAGGTEAGPSAIGSPVQATQQTSPPPRGTLVWQAKLDGTAADALDSPGGQGPADNAAVRFIPGAVEYTVLVRADAAGANSRVFNLSSPRRESFLLEMDVDAAAPFNMTINWWEAAGQRYGATVDIASSRIRFEYSRPLGAAMEPLVPYASAPIRQGAKFTLGISVERSRFVAFIDGRTVVEAVPDGRVPPAALPIKLGMSGREPGTLRVTGIRVFDLPGVALPSALASAGPANAPSRTGGPTTTTAPGRPVVMTASGAVRGSVSGRMVAYRGIPYAAPPVGPLRWKPPEPPIAWNETRDAGSYGSSCAQTGSAANGSSEDCLYLDVFTPGDGGSGRPVLVYIHGGGLTDGCGGKCGEPAPLVDAGAVVVTIQYRLGIFGFLAHPALGAESPGRTSGNYGLLDQLAALRWVRANIAAFGGDSGNVTVFGGSSGGFSIRVMLTSTAAAGLFHRAIVSSGSRREVRRLEDAERRGAQAVSRAGCPDQTVACLRALTASALLAAPAVSDPVVDGALIKGPIRDAIATGAFNRVPVLEGSTRDEGRLDIAQREWTSGAPLSASEVERVVRSLSNRGYDQSEAAAILARYPLSSFESASIAVAKVETDGQYACRSRATVRELSRFVPTYQYRFDGEMWPQSRASLLARPVSFPLGAFHGSDLVYLMPGASPATAPTAEQVALQAGLASAYVNFARTGSPGESWRTYSRETDEVMDLSYANPRGAASTSFAKDHDCSWWEAQPWWPDTVYGP